MRKISLNNLLVLFILIPTLILLFASAFRFKVQKFQDAHASGGILLSPLQLIFANISDDYYITVNGATFRHVRGSRPYYLEIPQLHSLLFVTGKVDCPATFHIFDIQSKQFKTIEGGPEQSGWDFNSIRKQGDPFTEWIADVTSNQVIVIHQFMKGSGTTFLELDKKRVVR